MNIVRIQEWLYYHKPVKRVIYLGSLFTCTFLIALGITPKAEETKVYTVLKPHYETFNKTQINSLSKLVINEDQKVEKSTSLSQKGMNSTHSQVMPNFKYLEHTSIRLI